MSVSKDLRNYIKELKPICEICGKNPTVDIHHKDQNKKNNSVGNLMALCEPCHYKKGLHLRKWGRRPITKIRSILRSNARYSKTSDRDYVREILNYFKYRCPYDAICLKKMTKEMEQELRNRFKQNKRIAL